MSGGEQEPWEAAADKVCAAMVKRAPDVLRKAAESLYETMLYDVQDYLRDNVELNLSSQLATAKRQAEEATKRASTLQALLESHEGGLRLLRRAIVEDDPKQEIVLRITDLIREANPLLAKATPLPHEGRDG